MAIMEFLLQNKVNTTTMIGVDSNTGTTRYLFDRNIGLGYTSSGYNSTTAATITYSFTAATVLSTLLIQNHNLKEFSVYYNGTTTNSLFSTTTNSITSTYISFSSITVSSIHLRAINTIAGSVEKKVGEMVATERKLLFERNPSFNDFDYA